MFKGRVVAAEGGSREGTEYNIVEADHNSIRRPRSKEDRRFYAVKNLIRRAVTTMEEEAKVREAHPQNFQSLPEEIVAMDAQVRRIVAKLESARKLGLAGMGGLEKTTIAKAVFNDLCSKFEYTCFVPNIKDFYGTEQAAKDAVREHMHHYGKKVGGKGPPLELQTVTKDGTINGAIVIWSNCHRGWQHQMS